CCVRVRSHVEAAVPQRRAGDHAGVGVGGDLDAVEDPQSQRDAFPRPVEGDAADLAHVRAAVGDADPGPQPAGVLDVRHHLVPAGHVGVAGDVPEAVGDRDDGDEGEQEYLGQDVAV